MSDTTIAAGADATTATARHHYHELRVLRVIRETADASSVVFEVPEDQIEPASAVIRQVMESAAEPAVRLNVPLGVEIGTGPNWGAAH